MKQTISFIEKKVCIFEKQILSSAISVITDHLYCNFFFTKIMFNSAKLNGVW